MGGSGDRRDPAVAGCACSVVPHVLLDLIGTPSLIFQREAVLTFIGPFASTDSPASIPPAKHQSKLTLPPIFPTEVPTSRLGESGGALMARARRGLVEQERPQRIAQASFVHFLSSHSFVKL